MNKLIFNEGGQPVYLDDFRVLQNNLFELFGGLTSAVVGDGVPFLLFPCETVFDFDGGTATVPAGKLVRYGVVYEFPETVIEGVYDATQIFICLKEMEVAERVFEDGQTRACQMNYSAYVTNDKTGASICWALSELKTWAWYLKRLAIEGGLETDVMVVFENDYNGTVKIQKVDKEGYSYVMSIAVSTSKTEYTWPPANPLAFVFYFASLEGLDYRDKIVKGAKSEVFTYGGEEYYLDIAVQGCTVKAASTNSAYGLPVIKTINTVVYF